MSLLDAKKSKSYEGGPSFSLGNRIYRAVWNMTWLLLCSWTPNILNFWRIFVLRLFGAQIPFSARVNAKATIWSPQNLTVGHGSTITRGVNCYNMGFVEIGSHVVLSQNAHLCAGSHNVESESFQLITKPILILDRAWIASEAFVGPGVTVAEGAVLGARGAAFKDLEPWSIYRGNPSVFVRKRKHNKI